MCTIEDINIAKKYLDENGYGTGTNFSFNTVANLMAEYRVKNCVAPPVSKSDGIERETSCKHSDWIDLYYSSGDLYGRYCNDCGEFFE